MAGTLAVEIADQSVDDDGLDELTTDLRDQLLILDVDDVARPSEGPAPDGARALELAALGALVISLGESSEAVGKVVSLIRDWLKHDPEPARTVKLTYGDRTLELSNATSAQQDRLVEAFIRDAETTGADHVQAAADASEASAPTGG